MVKTGPYLRRRHLWPASTQAFSIIVAGRYLSSSSLTRSSAEERIAIRGLLLMGVIEQHPLRQEAALCANFSNPCSGDDLYAASKVNGIRACPMCIPSSLHPFPANCLGQNAIALADPH